MINRPKRTSTTTYSTMDIVPSPSSIADDANSSPATATPSIRSNNFAKNSPPRVTDRLSLTARSFAWTGGVVHDSTTYSFIAVIRVSLHSIC